MIHDWFARRSVEASICKADFNSTEASPTAQRCQAKLSDRVQMQDNQSNRSGRYVYRALVRERGGLRARCSQQRRRLWDQSIFRGRIAQWAGFRFECYPHEPYGCTRLIKGRSGNSITPQQSGARNSQANAATQKTNFLCKLFSR